VFLQAPPFTLTTFDAPHKYVNSPIRPLRSPIVFAFARMLIAIYILATLLTTLADHIDMEVDGGASRTKVNFVVSQSSFPSFEIRGHGISPMNTFYSSLYPFLSTCLTYAGLCAYYFTSGVQSMAYALAWRRNGTRVGYAGLDHYKHSM